MKIKFNNKVLQRMIEFKVKVKEVPNVAATYSKIFLAVLSFILNPTKGL